MKDTPKITPDLLVQAYKAGVFPMAEGADDDALFWVDPPERGIIPIDGFHASRSLIKRLKTNDYEASLNQCFSHVMANCAARKVTWINKPITELFTELHHQGLAHSIEIWRKDELIGGVYGLALGGAFFGESMFSTQRDGSKLALFALLNLLRNAGFTLFDTQFLTPHLASLGGQEISRAQYRHLLSIALHQQVAPQVLTARPRYALTHSMTQIS